MFVSSKNTHTHRHIMGEKRRIQAETFTQNMFHSKSNNRQQQQPIHSTKTEQKCIYARYGGSNGEIDGWFYYAIFWPLMCGYCNMFNMTALARYESAGRSWCFIFHQAANETLSKSIEAWCEYYIEQVKLRACVRRIIPKWKDWIDSHVRVLRFHVHFSFLYRCLSWPLILPSFVLCFSPCSVIISYHTHTRARASTITKDWNFNVHRAFFAAFHHSVRLSSNFRCFPSKYIRIFRGTEKIARCPCMIQADLIGVNKNVLKINKRFMAAFSYTMYMYCNWVVLLLFFRWNFSLYSMHMPCVLLLCSAVMNESTFFGPYVIFNLCMCVFCCMRVCAA